MNPLKSTDKKSLIKYGVIGGVVLIFVLAYEVVLHRYIRMLEKPYLAEILLGLTALSVVSLVAVMWGSWFKGLALEKLFVLAFLLTGIMYIIVLPPFSAPDEVKHYATVFYYTNPSGADVRLDDKGMVIVRETDNDINHEEEHIPKASTYEHVIKGLKSGSGRGSASYTEPPLAVPMTAYIPQEIGAFVAGLLGLSGIATLYLMKFIMLLVAAAAGYFTIRIAPVGKMVFFVIFFFPMVLSLMTSANYDSTLDVLSFLLLAVILRLRYEKERVEIRDYIPILVISLIMVPIKVVYILLLGAVFIIPKEKYNSGRERILLNGALLAVNVAVMFIVRVSSISGLVSGNKTSIQFPWTVSQILSDIPRACTVFIYSFFEQVTFYYNTMIGSRLGWLELPVPEAVIIGFTVLLIIALYLKEKNGKGHTVTLKERIIYLMIFVLLYLGITAAMWIDSTAADIELIMGVQGRYFIPVLPMVLLIFKSERVSVDEAVSKYIPTALVVLNIFALGKVFEVICRR